MAKKELTAKEKYFCNEVTKLKKENRRLSEYIYSLEKEIDKYKAEVESLNKEGLILQGMVDKLCEEKGLTEETVRKYIEEDIKHTNAIESLLAIRENMRGWY